jgi:hypothetical protein
VLVLGIQLQRLIKSNYSFVPTLHLQNVGPLAVPSAPIVLINEKASLEASQRFFILTKLLMSNSFVIPSLASFRS